MSRQQPCCCFWLVLSVAWAALAAADGAASVPSNVASSVPIPISYSTTGVGAAQTRLQLNGAGIKIAIMDS